MRVRRAGGSVAYTFDALGNRIGRTETGGGTSSAQQYVIDAWDTAKPESVGTEGADVWADLDSSGAVTSRRLFGPGFDDPVARVDGGSSATSWYGSDGRGSVTSVFTTGGTVTGTRSYAAFGAVTGESGAGLDRYGYTAREWDGVAGLQYSRARMYDPAAGAFTGEDPMGFAAGDSNLRRYVGNGPTNASDPSGLQWWVFERAERYGNRAANFGHGVVDILAEPVRITGDGIRVGVYAAKDLAGVEQSEPEWRSYLVKGLPAPSRPIEEQNDYVRKVYSAPLEPVKIAGDVIRAAQYGVETELGWDPAEPDWRSEIARNAPLASATQAERDAYAMKVGDEYAKGAAAAAVVPLVPRVVKSLSRWIVVEWVHEANLSDRPDRRAVGHPGVVDLCAA